MDSIAVQKNIQELQTLRTQHRCWGWGIFGTLLLMVVISLAMLRNAVTSLATPGAAQEQFVTDLGERLQQNALPTIEQMGAQALREVDFEAEVKKLNARTPELAQESMDQMEMLSDNLPKRGQKVFDATFARVFKERESKIRTMFPEATEEQVAHLLATLTEEAQTQVVAINDSLFTPHKKALDNIVYDLTMIENSEKNANPSEIPTWEMALTMFDIIRADLQDLAPTKPKQIAMKTTEQTKAKEQKR